MNQLALLVGLIVGTTGSAGRPSADQPPIRGKPAPEFGLADASGKQHKLSELRGRPAVLFFYCGCEPCHACARVWSSAQVAAVDRKTGERTVIVFAGDGAAGKQFLSECGVDPKSALLLPDPNSSVSHRYGVDPCPRAFVVDSKGVLKYTNDQKDDRPPDAPAVAIVSKVLKSLRELTPAAQPNSSSKPG